MSFDKKEVTRERGADPEDYKDVYRIGQKIRRVRQSLRLSISELAGLTSNDNQGVSVSAISQIENGERNPTIGTLMKLSNALGVRMDSWFLDWSWEEFIHICPACYKDAFDTGVLDHANMRRPIPGAPADACAHASMVERNLYHFAGIDSVCQELARMGKLCTSDTAETGGPGPLQRMLPKFEGGVMQSVIFRPNVSSLDELVLDGHPGEELMFVLQGTMDYAILKRPDSRVIHSNDVRELRIEKIAINRLIKNGQELEGEGRRRDGRSREDGGLNPELLAYLKSIAEGPVEDGFYKAECEIFRLQQGSIIQYKSDWPHGGVANAQWVDEQTARKEAGEAADPRVFVFFSTYGSYFAPSTA